MHDSISDIRVRFPYFYTLGSFIRSKAVLAGGFLILILCFTAIFAPWLVPNDPFKQDVGPVLASSGLDYPLGTDEMGRCVLSRLLFGTRVSLTVGVVVSFTTAVIGTVIGMVAAYYGGIIDDVLMRLVDVLLAFPNLIFLLAVVGTLGPGLGNTILALVVLGWLNYARVARGSTLSLKETDFIQAARSLGYSNIRIIFKHILPNILSPVIILATFDIPHTILAVAGLSFLGLGVQPPVPEWGAMLNAGKTYMRTNPLLMLAPGIMIMITVLAFNLVGTGIKNALDPCHSENIGNL